MKNATPTHTALVELWMETHFKGVPALVIFDPLGNGERPALIKDRFGICETATINATICVLPVAQPEAIVLNLNEDEWGFVMSWDGETLTSENT
jgi:hypothetical protein